MASLYRLSAIIIVIFLGLHLTSVLLVMEGTHTQVAFLGLVRMIYRHPLIEIIVLMAFLIQLIAGVGLVKAGLGLRTGLGIESGPSPLVRLNALAWLYLCFFALSHIAVISYGRLVEHADTDLGFIVGAIHSTPVRFALMAYYALGITALFVHISACLFTPACARHKALGYSALVAGSVIAICGAVLVVMILNGHFVPLDALSGQTQWTDARTTGTP